MLLFSPEGLAQTFNLNKQIKGFGQISNQINSIAQDKKGFVWITTNNGTQYSDGILSHQLPDSIKSGFQATQKVHVDDDGLVWVYQSNEVPVIYHFDKSWHKLPIVLPETRGNKAIPKIDFFTVGTGDRKLLFLVLPDLILRYHYSDFKSAGALSRPEYISTAELGAFHDSFFSAQDSIFLFEKGMFLLNDVVFSKIYHPLTTEEEKVVKMIYVEKTKKYYFLSTVGLYEGDTYDQVSESIYSGFRNQPIGGQEAYDLFWKGDELFFHFNSHLHQYNMLHKRGVEIPAYDDMRVRQIATAMVDREGVIWLGTFRGLANLSSLRFQNFGTNSGLPDLDISAAILLKRHHYLVGFEGGIQLWVGRDPVKTIYFSDEKGLGRSDRVLNFAMDKRGNVWFSAYQHGLGFFNPQNKTIIMVSLPDDEPVSYVMIENEQLWAVGSNKVYQAQLPKVGQKPHFQIFNFNLPDDAQLGFIRKIGKLDNGKWVIATGGGGSGKVNLKHYEHLIRFAGYDFLEKKDTLFLGTENGFYFLDNEVLSKVDLNGKEINHPVYSILEDEESKIWLGTDSGVFLLENGNIRVFNENNGLIGNDVSRGALVQADKGRVLIGTQNGISVYHPIDDSGPPTAPTVILEKVSVSNVEDDEFNLLKIPYQLNNIVFTYSAASFTSSPKLVINYQLEGYQNEWVSIENPRSNELYFNNLPPGKYRLAIKALLTGHNPSETVYSSFFTISYPFYLQAWFILLIILFFIGLGIGINIFFRQNKNQVILKDSLDAKTSEMKSRDDQFRNVWNSSQDGLMLSIIGGEVVAVNPALCELGKVNEEDLKEKGLSYLFKNPDFYHSIREKISADLEKINEEGLTTELNMPFRTGNKEIELYISRMDEDFKGKPFYLSVFRDISRKKAYEQGLKVAKEKAEEASKLKSSIISNMSHEVRTPLNGILGSTENIIQSRIQDRELVEQLNIIRESGERLLKTMNDILDLSLIESDNMNMKWENTNVNDFISKILVNHKSVGIKKGILVSAKFLTKPFLANIERKYLETVVNNIVGNALKYSDKGQVQVLVQRKDGKLFLQVKDEGIGISKDHLQKLFYPFEQESKGFDRKFEGSGIGLAITKHILEFLCGKIFIDSEKGMGTTVTVIIPLDN